MREVNRRFCRVQLPILGEPVLVNSYDQKQVVVCKVKDEERFADMRSQAKMTGVSAQRFTSACIDTASLGIIIKNFNDLLLFKLGTLAARLAYGQ
jgi:hypothetical protein